mmetsp:Transcript_20344/g.35086  ORF Transcript_20344/g.35086 Transcript_20344/m.35086 type:complete len:409 (-) Transcript_20344:1002-2228(-)
MGSSTELHAVLPPIRVFGVAEHRWDVLSNRHHTDHWRVLLAEHGAQTHNLHCGTLLDLLREDGTVLGNLLVDQFLRASDLCLGQLRRPREIKPRHFLVDERPLLIDLLKLVLVVLTDERLPQGEVQDVGASMVGGHVEAARQIHLAGCFIPLFHLSTRFQCANVHSVSGVCLRVLHLEHSSRENQRANVSDLTTSFRVEICLVQQDPQLSCIGSSLRRECLFLVVVDGNHLSGAVFPNVFGFVHCGCHLPDRFQLVQLVNTHEALLGCHGSTVFVLVLLLLHMLIESLHINSKALLLCHQECQIHGESIAVMQNESIFASDAVVLCLRDSSAKMLHTSLPSFAEQLFFLCQGGLNAALVRLQLRKRIRHGLNNSIHNVLKESILCTKELLAISDGSPHNPPQHKTSSN